MRKICQISFNFYHAINYGNKRLSDGGSLFNRPVSDRCACCPRFLRSEGFRAVTAGSNIEFHEAHRPVLTI